MHQPSLLFNVLCRSGIVIAFDGVSFSKHGQVKGYFNRELIKTKILPKELGQLYNKAFEYRQKFDYVDFAVPDRDMVLDYIKKSKDFRNDIEKFLNSKLRIQNS